MLDNGKHTRIFFITILRLSSRAVISTSMLQHTGVPERFGNGDLCWVIRGEEPPPPTVWGALSVVKYLMVCPENFSVLSVHHERKMLKIAHVEIQGTFVSVSVDFLTCDWFYIAAMEGTQHAPSTDVRGALLPLPPVGLLPELD